MSLAPLLLFVYNRPYHTRKTIEALLENESASETDLIIYSDASIDPFNNKVLETRNYIKSVIGFRSIVIIERSKNWGLSRNIIDGVTSVINEYGKVIVLEDDLVVSPFFLKYMNEALDFYEKEEQIVCIHGYVYPVKRKLPETFFIKGADCWGWATWKRGWDLFCLDGKFLLDEINRYNMKREFDFEGSYPYYKMLKRQVEGSNDSWAIRWYASAFLNNKLTLYPGTSLVTQIGMDGSGTHCGANSIYDVQLLNRPINISKIPIEQTLSARKIFTYYFRYTMKIAKLRSYIKRMIK
ncbi:glycosyltransferase [uncultured Parabacteroides sp.]|uniref:glycosyltransferase n=1 Tax=uncultured Parabacteroides sp. TaxID=512312 RepID=UPI002594BDF3|nr:glycosyltransferase [uncultured Parabacteroides sp.]